MAASDARIVRVLEAAWSAYQQDVISPLAARRALGEFVTANRLRSSSPP